MSKALVKHAAEKRENLIERLHQAMRMIEKEVEENEGIYPLNKGRITQAELCRRAHITQPALQSPTHKATTLKEINEWLTQVKTSALQGKKTIRKHVLQRVDASKEIIRELRQRYCEAEAEIENLQRRVQALEAQLKEK